MIRFRQIGRLPGVISSLGHDGFSHYRYDRYPWNPRQFPIEKSVEIFQYKNWFIDVNASCFIIWQTGTFWYRHHHVLNTTGIENWWRMIIFSKYWDTNRKKLKNHIQFINMLQRRSNLHKKWKNFLFLDCVIFVKIVNNILGDHNYSIFHYIWKIQADQSRRQTHRQAKVLYDTVLYHP